MQEQKVGKPKVQAMPVKTEDRVLDLAREIFLTLAVSNDTRTPERHAAMAFEKAAVFWAYADKKKNEVEK